MVKENLIKSEEVSLVQKELEQLKLELKSCMTALAQEKNLNANLLLKLAQR